MPSMTPARFVSIKRSIMGTWGSNVKGALAEEERRIQADAVGDKLEGKATAHQRERKRLIQVQSVKSKQKTCEAAARTASVKMVQQAYTEMVAEKAESKAHDHLLREEQHRQRQRHLSKAKAEDTQLRLQRTTAARIATTEAEQQRHEEIWDKIVQRQRTAEARDLFAFKRHTQSVRDDKVRKKRAAHVERQEAIQNERIERHEELMRRREDNHHAHSSEKGGYLKQLDRLRKDVLQKEQILEAKKKQANTTHDYDRLYGDLQNMLADISQGPLPTSMDSAFESRSPATTNFSPRFSPPSRHFIPESTLDGVPIDDAMTSLSDAAMPWQRVPSREAAERVMPSGQMISTATATSSVCFSRERRGVTTGERNRNRTNSSLESPDSTGKPSPTSRAIPSPSVATQSMQLRGSSMTQGTSLQADRQDEAAEDYPEDRQARLQYLWLHTKLEALCHLIHKTIAFVQDGQSTEERNINSMLKVLGNDLDALKLQTAGSLGLKNPEGQIQCACGSVMPKDGGSCRKCGRFNSKAVKVDGGSLVLREYLQRELQKRVMDVMSAMGSDCVFVRFGEAEIMRITVMLENFRIFIKTVGLGTSGTNDEKWGTNIGNDMLDLNVSRRKVHA